MYSVNEQFVIALKQKNFQEAQRLLDDEGADINARNSRDETPAYFFAAAPTLNTLNWLIERGADLDIPNRDGNTPLFSAVLRNDALAVDALLTAGANPDLKNARKIAPLFQAVLNQKDHGVVDRLLEAMPDVNTVSETQTSPLLAAAAHGKADYVAKLLDAGADPEQVDYLGQGLLYAAVASQDANVLRVVVEKCPILDPNYAARSGTTAMSLTLGQPEMTEMLLDMGGDPMAKSGNRFSDGVNLLMGVLAADQNFALPMKEKAAAQINMMGGPGSSDELVKKMLQKGARPEVRADGGQNAGYFVVQSGSVGHLPDLIAHGLDPARPLDPSGLLPYDLALADIVDRSSPELLDLISQWKSMGFPFSRPEWDEKLDGPWTSSIAEACKPRMSVLQNYFAAGFLDGVNHVLGLGADINEKSLHGRTLAHIIVASGYDGMTPEVKKALSLARRAKNIDQATKDQQLAEIKQEAESALESFRNLVNKFNIDWQAQDDQGATPLHMAAQQGDMEWARYLMQDIGVNPAVRNKEGLTAAGVALRTGQVPMFHALVETARQHNVDLLSGVVMDTVQASSDDFRQRQPWLRAMAALDYLAPQVNNQDADGQTALYFASGTDQHDVVRTLLRLGANPSIAAADGNTPLMQATFNESGEIIRLLRAAGAKPEQANNQGASALDVADYVKSLFIHNALRADDLGELIADLDVPPLSEKDKKFQEVFNIKLDNVVRSWTGQPLLDVPVLEEEKPQEDPQVSSSAAPAPVAPSAPAVAAPLPTPATRKGP